MDYCAGSAKTREKKKGKQYREAQDKKRYKKAIARRPGDGPITPKRVVRMPQTLHPFAQACSQIGIKLDVILCPYQVTPFYCEARPNGKIEARISSETTPFELEILDVDVENKEILMNSGDSQFPCELDYILYLPQSDSLQIRRHEGGLETPSLDAYHRTRMPPVVFFLLWLPHSWRRTVRSMFL